MDRHTELFNCTLETRADRAIVRPFGELDCWNVPFVEQHLLAAHDAGIGHVELDLSGLSFLDSSAVALVVRWSRVSVERGFLLHVRAGSPRVRRIFEITAITHLLADDVAPEQVL
jgi:anti-sigma B factor antagonist